LATTSEAPVKEQSSKRSYILPAPRDIQEDTRQDKILKECEGYLKDSKRLREIAALKASGKNSYWLDKSYGHFQKVFEETGSIQEEARSTTQERAFENSMH